MSSLTRTVLAAAPANVQAQAISASAINLTWSARSGATGYVVRRNGVTIGTPSANSFGDTGLSASTSYTYTVATVAASGEGPQGTGVQGTTLAAPDTTAPTAPVITATTTGQSTISVALTTPATDSQSGISSYDLEYKTAAAATYTAVTGLAANQFPYVIGTLSPATTYDTRARARDGVGNIGPYSTVSNATTQSASGNPYPWYSAFDTNDLPFTINAPAAPSIFNGTVNVTPATIAANKVNGRRLILEPGDYGNQLFSTQDQEIILQDGALIDVLTTNNTTRRLLIRGEAPRVGRIKTFSTGGSANRATDVIVDGVTIDDAFDPNSISANQWHGDRFAVVNSFIRQFNYAFGAFHNPTDFFIANCHIHTYNADGFTNGQNGESNFRTHHALRMVIWDNRIQRSVGTKHTLRIHSTDTSQRETDLIYVARNQLDGARVAIRGDGNGIESAGGAGPNAGIGTVWFEENRIYQPGPRNASLYCGDTTPDNDRPTMMYVRDNQLYTNQATYFSPSTPRATWVVENNSTAAYQDPPVWNFK